MESRRLMTHSATFRHATGHNGTLMISVASISSEYIQHTCVMMTGAKVIQDSHREKGVEETHTWNNMTKTCTPIVYAQAVV